MPWRESVRDALTRLLRRGLRVVRPESRNAMAVALLLSGHDRAARPVARWPEQRVAVLSPHPDDEAIGCAGAVLHHVAAGAQVRVVHVADGAQGDRRLHQPGLDAATRATMQQALVAERRAEALAWARDAGVADVRFLDLPDGAVQPTPAAVRRLAAWLDEQRPELVYLPFVMDGLEDHWQTARLFAAAAARCGAWSRRLRVRAYEVWSPLPANRVVDITDLAGRKHALLGLYASQLRDVDYRRTVAGLNTYRSMLLPGTGCGQAEAFFECSLAGWLDIVRRAAQPPRLQAAVPVPPTAEPARQPWPQAARSAS